MEILAGKLGKDFDMERFSKQDLSEEERKAQLREIMQRRVDAYNASPGKLRDGYTINSAQGENTPVSGDGYNCPICKNRGDFLVLSERMGGIYEQAVLCKCMDIRKSIWRMRASGLEKIIRDCTFDRFEVTEPWQQSMVDKAKAYLAEGEPAGKWFFIGGQPGCGKTHICTAIVRDLLYRKPVQYMPWERDSKRLKAIVNEAEDYGKEIGALNTAPVLYIDDLFKPVPDEYGEPRLPTSADIRLAFEIINYRNINHLPTIISSEWPMDKLIDIDEATASRINENCEFGKYVLGIGRDRTKNHRLSGQTML